MVLDDVPAFEELVETGKHISFTERRSQDAERELRNVKILTLLQDQIGQEFDGVVTGITNFGIFIQLTTYLVDGLIRYEDLMDDWWDVDERGGFVRGQRTGTRIGIGDVVKVFIVKVDLARRELGLAISELRGREMNTREKERGDGKHKSPAHAKPPHRPENRHHGGKQTRPGGFRRGRGGGGRGRR